MANALTGPARTYTATIVAICPADRSEETKSALRGLHTRTGVRPIVVTLGDRAEPPLNDEAGAIVIDGLTPRYLNNVVAARRLSSLPAIAWWRGGDPSVLDGLAALVDRLVMDSIDPRQDWAAALPLLDVTAFADLRWTRLTRWRNLMAQFFDVPAIRTAAEGFSRLEVVAGDASTAQLFAGWLSARLPSGPRLEVATQNASGPHAMVSATLSGPVHRLELRLTPNGTCVHSSIDGGSLPTAARTVSLGDQSPASLLEEELRIRARDTGFEQALRFAAGVL
jgi:glucose-6-phosphate dehydrogenase assembly protein OpcA